MACSEGSAPMVWARMLWTRLRGGSASSKPFSQCIPARASSTMLRQEAQPCWWASKAASVGPCKVPSSASARRASTSTHCIPDWFRLPLTCLLIRTLQKPCQFRSSPIYATLHSSLGYIEHFGNVLVVQILQIAQNHRFPELGREPLQGLVYQFLCFLASYPGFRTGDSGLPIARPASTPLPGCRGSRPASRLPGHTCLYGSGPPEGSA